MELIRIKFKMVHRTSNTIIFDGFWDIPQCKESEFDALTAAFIDYTGVSGSTSVDICDNFMGPTYVYDWIARNTTLWNTTVPFNCTTIEYPSANDYQVIRAYDAFFPMASTRDNFANRLYLCTPDRYRGSNHYAEWDVDLITSDATYAVTVSTYNRGSGGSGYYSGLAFDPNNSSSFSGGSNSRGFPQLTFRYAQNNTGYYAVPVRLTNDDGEVIKLTICDVFGNGSSYPFKTTANTIFPPNNSTNRSFDVSKPIDAFLAGRGDIFDPRDPYNGIPNSGPSDPDGDFDPSDDQIPDSTLPVLSFASTGFCRIYRPSLAQLSALANYMWTDQTFLQTLANHVIQLLENPMESIISLSLVPCVPDAGADQAVKVMFISIPDVTMPPVTNQFVDVDCGTFALEKYYGSALDYNPYTKVSCFLPYIGMVELDTDEVMGTTLQVVYRIDVVSGACVAKIKSDSRVLYQFSGHCSIQMPVNSADFSGYISATIGVGKLVAGLGASAAGAPIIGGALLNAPPMGSPSTTETITDGGTTVYTKRNEATGRQVKALTVRSEPERKVTTHRPGGVSLGELAVRSTINTVGAVMNSKFGVQHSGGFSGNSGVLGVRYPYLIIKRPNLCNPEEYGKYNGRPSMMYSSLSSCTGYTEVQSIQLTGIPATNPELSEIATLLKSGVIL